MTKEKIYKISVFRWSPSKKTLCLKRKMEYGNFPYTLWIQGKLNRVKFVHSTNDMIKQRAIYTYDSVSGPPNPHIDKSITVVIPW